MQREKEDMGKEQVYAKRAGLCKESRFMQLVNKKEENGLLSLKEKSRLTSF